MLIRTCAWHKPKWLGFMGFKWGKGKWGVSHGICRSCAKRVQLC
ncbi:hypothetical protein LCGC14_1208160 [marine sediment metagenome]|uniref:Uncharacterized protein n=1 Tax=marine sediment metagenome TaxID=412755 RepID=A0A0F9NX78_9ZZZZ